MRNLTGKELATIICFTLGSQACAHGSEAEFEQHVIDVILDRPEIVFAALKILERTQAEEDRLEAQQVVQENAGDLFEPGGAGNLAPGMAPLIIEFFDYRCAYCAQSVSITDQFAEVHGDRVRLIEFPILGPVSEKMSRLAIAVRNIEGLETYKAFRSRIFAEFERPKTHQTARLIIAEMGLDVDRIVAASEQMIVTDELAKNNELGLALGINGTPAYVGEFGIGGGVHTLQQLEDLSGVAQ